MINILFKHISRVLNTKVWVCIAIMFLLVSFSCNQERQPCLTPKIAAFNLEFVHHVTDTSTVPTDTALPRAVFGSFTQTGVKYEIFPQQATFTISLSSQADSCKYLFTTDSLINALDTFTFFYKRQLHFVSNACGFVYFYNLDSFHTTHNNVDSAFIISNSVTNNVKPTHFRVYIHPDY